MAGNPSQPYMKTAFKGAFRASIPSETHIVMRGRETAAFTEMKIRPPRLAGNAIAVQNMKVAAMSATSPFTSASPIQMSVESRIGRPIRSRKAPSQKLWIISSPIRLKRFAPKWCPAMGESP